MEGAAAELRRFLDRNQISYRWLAPGAPEAAEDAGEGSEGEPGTAEG